MRIAVYFSVLLSLGVSRGIGTTHTITSPGFTFSPDSIVITSGDTVTFSIAAMHNAVEVSHATWNANDTTRLAGGFAVPFGGGSVVLNQTGTHYFVCQAHAFFGMKGIIVVNSFVPNTITIESMIDQDGSLSSTGDRVAKNWSLKLYRDSVGSGDVLGSVASGPSLTVGGLSPGTYVAFEADSIGWSHFDVGVDGSSQGGLSTNQFPITVNSGETHTITFINFARHTIVNSGFTFLPDSILVGSGDTVQFVLEPMHTAREVSESTWLADDTVSNGGFDLPFGGGRAILTQLGTHYYVCVPHGSIGMKGRIVVATIISRNVSDGWNMTSLPMKVIDPRVSAAYPTAISQAFSYQGTYQANTTLENGRGYWLKFSNSQVISVSGSPVIHDTIDASKGWNMIGSISSQIPTSSINSDPPGIINSQYFGYNGGYFITDTIFPGFGYWVRASQQGKFNLDSGATMSPFKTVMMKGMPGTANRITASDAAGHSQTIYFVTSGSGVPFESDFTPVPPLPPAGSFDVRFAGDRLICVPGEGDENGCPIQISSASYPVTLSWDIPPAPRGFLLHVHGEAVALKGNGSIRLTAPDRTLALSAGGPGTSPREFALGPAFPDPFNPSTTIEYQLPIESNVALRVYNILGQQVATLEEGVRAAGTWPAKWDARNNASGVYIIRFEASGTRDLTKSFLQVERIILQK